MVLESAYTVRPEEPCDHAAIFDLTKRAFAPMAFAAGDEQDVINRLRETGALSLSLVADKSGVIIGHVALSPVTHDTGAARWFGLGPIAVEPHQQRQGIGTALIAAAKGWLLQKDAHGCILVGDTNYYSRHGFLPAPEHAPDNEPAEYFMVWPNETKIPAGRFRFHHHFYG